MLNVKVKFKLIEIYIEMNIKPNFIEIKFDWIFYKSLIIYRHIYKIYNLH